MLNWPPIASGLPKPSRGNSSGLCCNKSMCWRTGWVLGLDPFPLLGFLPAFFGPPAAAMLVRFGPLFDLLYDVTNSCNVPFNCAKANVCSRILVERFMQLLSHLKEPPLPGVTLWTLLETPATIKKPSDAPGFGTTLPGVETRVAALSNNASRIAMGTVVIPLSRAVRLRAEVDRVSLWFAVFSRITSSFPSIPVIKYSDSFLNFCSWVNRPKDKSSTAKYSNSFFSLNGPLPNAARSSLRCCVCKCFWRLQWSDEASLDQNVIHVWAWSWLLQDRCRCIHMEDHPALLLCEPLRAWTLYWHQPIYSKTVKQVALLMYIL